MIRYQNIGQNNKLATDVIQLSVQLTKRELVWNISLLLLFVTNNVGYGLVDIYFFRESFIFILDHSDCPKYLDI